MTLAGPIKAGSWHLVADGIVLDPVDVTFDVLWRDAGGDHPIATWQHHFDPQPTGFDAVAFEADAPGVEAKAKSNDQLVLRFTVQGSGTGVLYIPNGDGTKAKARIPTLTLPK
ncbi:MAG: hypothetical protein JWN44_3736 [Myxococcales bacterium]|nr:hypothetical protein [Myxococcales bacterium]